jgi:hypothetical protein
LVAPLLGEGKILLINPVANLSDPVSLFRMQKCGFITPSQGAGMKASNSSGCRSDIAVQGGWDTHLP